MDHARLAEDLPVAWNGGDPEVPEDPPLWNGHPGRITDPNYSDVFVSWVGLTESPLSRHFSWDFEYLEELTEPEFERRSKLVVDGRYRPEGVPNS